MHPTDPRGRLGGAGCEHGAKFVLRYLHVEFHRSAFKHGYGEPVILHAVEHALVIVDLDQDGDPPRMLAVGPDFAGNLVEVIWLELAGQVELVIHAMHLQPALYDLLPTGEDPPL